MGEIFPRPPKGPTPMIRGASKIPTSDAAFTPTGGKDSSHSSMAERKRGYTFRTPIVSDAKSDPLFGPKRDNE